MVAFIIVAFILVALLMCFEIFQFVRSIIKARKKAKKRKLHELNDKENSVSKQEARKE